MEIAGSVSPELSAGSGPAFQKRWNGWTVLWVFAVLAIFFVLVQGLALVAWIYIGFPDVIHAMQNGDPVPLMKLVQTQAGIARILTPTGFLAIQAPTTLIMVPLTFLLARSAFGANAKDLGFGRPLPLLTLLIAVAVGIGLFFLSFALEAIQDVVFGPHPQQIALVLAKHRGVSALALDLLSASVLAPLIEELLFRGVLFTSLVQRMPLPFAAVISGFVFGFAHLDFWNVILLWVVGIGLAYVYYRTGNIWANIVTHGTFNGMALILPVFFPQLNN